MKKNEILMKKHVLLYLMLAMAVLLTSCHEEEDEPGVDPIEDVVEVSYTLTSQIDIPTLMDYARQIQIFSRLPKDQEGNISTILNTFFAGNMSTRLYCYEYPSVDPDGQPVTLSAALFLPQAALTGATPIDRLMLGHHFSSMRYDECPTVSGCIEGLLAWKNSAVVLPDYYGFGSTRDKCQAYLNPDMAGRGALDALLAGKKLMKDLGVALPEDTYNIGYSQGGFNAVATLRYLALHPEYKVDFTRTFAGGGPYNVMDTFVSYLGGGFGDVFPLVLVTIISFNELEHLGIPYADLFKEPLLSHYQEWILSKNYDTSKVISLLGSTASEDHLTENLTSLKGTVYESFAAVADKYSLTKGWTPRSGTKLTLIHSRADNMVPFSNHEALTTFLNGQCELQEEALDTPAFLQESPHAGAYINFLFKILSGINIPVDRAGD